MGKPRCRDCLDCGKTFHGDRAQCWSCVLKHRRPMRECERCHMPFRATRATKRLRATQGQWTRYCSTTCSNRADADRRRKPPPAPSTRIWIVDCVECERAVVVRRSNARYCSRRCGERAFRKAHPRTSFVGEERTCPRPRCRAAFIQARPGQVYCTTRCYNAERRRNDKARRRARRRGVERETYRPLDIYERDRWTCGLCGKRIHRNQRAPHPLAPTIDHVIPMSLGGNDTKANVQAAHFLCNSIKGTSGCNSQLRLVG